MQYRLLYYCYDESRKFCTDFSMRQQESPVPIVTSLQLEPYVDGVSNTVFADRFHTSKSKLYCFDSATGGLFCIDSKTIKKSKRRCI